MNPFLATLEDRLGRAPVWIDCERYAARVFAGSPVDWCTNAQRFSATMAQAHGLTRSDVVAVPGLAGALADGAWLREEGSVAHAIEAAVKRAGHRAFLDEVLASLSHRLDGKAALVLELPSPGELLKARGLSVPYAFDDLDDVAAVLVPLVSELSRQPLEALVCASASAAGLDEDEDEACEPLFNAAHNYGWGVVMRLDRATAATVGPLPGLELVGEHLPGGLPAEIWLDDAAPVPPAAGVLFGTIPPDAEPELVARRMRELAPL